MASQDEHILVYIFVYFWFLYYAIHLILFTKDCIVYKIKKWCGLEIRYPYLYDDNTIIHIPNKNYEENTYINDIEENENIRIDIHEL